MSAGYASSFPSAYALAKRKSASRFTLSPIGPPGVSPRGRGSSTLSVPRKSVTTPWSSSTRIRNDFRVVGSKALPGSLCSCGGKVSR